MRLFWGVLKIEDYISDKFFVFCVSILPNISCRELLRGPLYYVLVLSVCTVFFWRESPVGMLGLATMCGGDGKKYVSSALSQFIFCGFFLICIGNQH